MSITKKDAHKRCCKLVYLNPCPAISSPIHIPLHPTALSQQSSQHPLLHANGRPTVHSFSSRPFFPYRSFWHSETVWTLRLDNIDQRMVTASYREKQRIGGWALWERSPTGHNTLQTWRQALRSVLLVNVRHDFQLNRIFFKI